MSENERIQTKPLVNQITPLVQRQVEVDEEEEESIQMKPDTGQPQTVSPTLANRIDSLKGGGQPFPKSVRDFFEPRFGYDFSGVRVHSDTPANETAQRMSARAYTMGQNIVFGTNQYIPESMDGKDLLAHELTHVVQQTRENNINSVSTIQCKEFKSIYTSDEWRAGVQNMNDDELINFTGRVLVPNKDSLDFNDINILAHETFLLAVVAQEMEKRGKKNQFESMLNNLSWEEYNTLWQILIEHEQDQKLEYKEDYDSIIFIVENLKLQYDRRKVELKQEVIPRTKKKLTETRIKIWKKTEEILLLQLKILNLDSIIKTAHVQLFFSRLYALEDEMVKGHFDSEFLEEIDKELELLESTFTELILEQENNIYYVQEKDYPSGGAVGATCATTAAIDGPAPLGDATCGVIAVGALLATAAIYFWGEEEIVRKEKDPELRQRQDKKLSRDLKDLSERLDYILKRNPKPGENVWPVPRIRTTPDTDEREEDKKRKCEKNFPGAIPIHWPSPLWISTRGIGDPGSKDDEYDIPKTPLLIKEGSTLYNPDRPEIGRYKTRIQNPPFNLTVPSGWPIHHKWPLYLGGNVVEPAEGEYDAKGRILSSPNLVVMDRKVHQAWHRLLSEQPNGPSFGRGPSNSTPNGTRFCVIESQEIS